MPPNAVVDASVLVSAFLFPDSVPGQILKLAAAGMFTMCLTPILIEETRRSLLNPRLVKSYGHDQNTVTAWCEALATQSKVFTDPLPDLGPLCRDPNDDHVIAAAVATGATFIVTGDNDLLVLGEVKAVRILTARAFLTERLN